LLNLYQKQVQISRQIFVVLDGFARRRFLSIVFVFFLSFGGSWLWAQSHGIPIPYVMDEFSYLLAGDTFAHGRVTNLTQPMRVHFETFYVQQHPTYMSIYPPAQGAFLALGKIIFGHPIYGVWLSSALMCAAICWMLYAWVSPRWALIGGLVAVLQFGIFTYWSQSYWGGAVAAMGGALIAGAMPRVFKYQRLRDVLILGLGIGVLVNTRPLEGILIGIPLGCLVLPWKIKWRAVDKRRFLKNVVLPLGLLILTVALLTGNYNKKITGNAWVFPHVLYSKLYTTIPLFLWQPLYPAVHYDHQVFADYVKKYAVIYYHEKRTSHGFIHDIQEDGFWLSMFFFGFPLAVPSLPILLQFFFHHKTALRFWAALVILLSVCAAMTCSTKPHYFAPFTCLAVLLIVLGLRGLAALKFRQVNLGGIFVIFLLTFQLFLNIILTPALPVVKSLARNAGISRNNLPPFFTRERLKRILIKSGGKYLVIVTYPPTHNYFFEWVYNDSDIDHSPIVWARNMGADHNNRLFEYFKDRKVLFIQVYWDIVGFPYYQARQ
jgi:hypothetical protein